MSIIDGNTGTLAEAVPRRRRRIHAFAAIDEPSESQPRGSGAFGRPRERQHASAAADLNAVKVLIVDDDPASLDYFAFALERCGAVVSVATGAREALRMISRLSPDVILSDIAMPGGDGYWLLNEIRRHADAHVHRVPMVAATAYGRDHSRARVLAAGFHEHLSKPVDPDLLCRAIASAVGR